MNAPVSRFRAWLDSSAGHWRGVIHRPSWGSLRVQFTFGILIVLVPTFTVSYLLMKRLAVQEISGMARLRLSSEAELLSCGLREWGNSNRLML